MLTIDDLQDGDQIFVADNNLMSGLIQNAQGDFEWSHVCSFYRVDGKPTIYTTGAYFDWKQLGFVYGAVDAVEYLSKRRWTAQRRTDLTRFQQKLRHEFLQHLVNTKVTYAVAKLIQLASWRFKAGVADKLSKNPSLDRKVIFNPDKVFCSESEALSILYAKSYYTSTIWGSLTFEERYTKALKEINSKYPQKLEACVHTPETLYDAPASAVIEPAA